MTESNLHGHYLRTVIVRTSPFQQAFKDKLNTKIALLIDLIPESPSQA